MEALLGFLISLLISGIIIYVVTVFFGERKGFGRAILTALIGAIIFGVTYYFLSGWIATVAGGIGWLIAIGNLYDIGRIKSFLVALIVWLLAAFVNLILPTISGPL